MRYTTENNKTIVIPDKEIKNLIANLQITQDEAIDLWLCDNNLEEDEEQIELDKKASKVRIDKDIIQKKPKKERKKPEKKISDAKKELFNEILSDLQDVYKENVEILNENKLISVRIGEKLFKIDVIETRPPKK